MQRQKVKDNASDFGMEYVRLLTASLKDSSSGSIAILGNSLFHWTIARWVVVGWGDTFL